LIFLCRLVGDNIDINIQAKIQSQTHTNRSIHWTQQYAIRSRINEPSFDTKSPQIPLKDIDLIQLLPDKKVQQNLKMRWASLVGRVICKYLAKFKHLNSVAVHHIIMHTQKKWHLSSREWHINTTKKGRMSIPNSQKWCDNEILTTVQ
jgi:hypothetical protein